MPPPKGRGYPAKQARNLTSLRNQAKVLPEQATESDDEQQVHLVQETLVKNDLCQEENDTSSAESEQSDWGDLKDDEFADLLIKKAREDILDGNNPFGDPDWIPESLQHQIAQKAKNTGSECYNLSG